MRGLRAALALVRKTKACSSAGFPTALAWVSRNELLEANVYRLTTDLGFYRVGDETFFVHLVMYELIPPALVLAHQRSGLPALT